MPKELTRVDAGHLLERLAVHPPGDDTDERILSSAAQLVLGHGLGGFEVDAVAERSGVGRSTIYRRFGDRNTLLTAALAHEGRRFLTILAAAVAHVDDPVEQVVVAFCAGLRLARDGGLAGLLRSDEHLLRMLTVDGGPVLAAARDELATLARRRDPGLAPREAAVTAELLIRLAISFLLVPDSALGAGDGCEEAVRRHLGPLLSPDPG